MGTLLTATDEATHAVGEAGNWNESRYVDFWDPAAEVGGWFRIGNRPNEGHAEVSTCVFLPDGTVAFGFGRQPVTTNELAVGGQAWEIVEPWHRSRFGFDGELSLLGDPWALTDPKQALSASPKVPATVALDVTTAGLDATLGSDQDHVGLIFLPGQADFHYQHLAHVTGTVRVGDRTYTVDGRGGKDHSWGPRNWHAKIYLRWLVAGIDDGNGFMLTRAVGPTKETRSGFVLDDGTFHLVEYFVMRNTYAGGPHHELLTTTVEIRSGERRWTAVGTPHNWLPLRHRQTNPAGELATLRIVKSPTGWELGDGRTGVGHCEYHDRIEGGVPVGLHD